MNFSEAAEGLDFKHGEKTDGKVAGSSNKAKKEEKKNKTAAQNKAEVAKLTELPEDELEEGVLEKDDQDTAHQLQAKATPKAAFSIKVFKLKKEDTCTVCPKKTTTAFALYKQGQVIYVAKCDTAFCLLATLPNYFLQKNRWNLKSKYLKSKSRHFAQQISGCGWCVKNAFIFGTK